MIALSLNSLSAKFQNVSYLSKPFSLTLDKDWPAVNRLDKSS